MFDPNYREDWLVCFACTLLFVVALIVVNAF